MDNVEFRCPSCKNLLQVPADKAGKQAKCPHCATLVIIPGPVGVSTAVATAPLPAPERLDAGDEDEDVFDPRAAARARRTQWWFTRLALVVMFSGGCIVVAGLLIEQIAHLIMTVQLVKGLSGSVEVIRPGDDPDKGARIIVRITRILIWLGSLVCVSGYALNFLGPRKIAPLALTGGCVLLGGLNLILAGIFRIFYSFSVREGLSLPIWLYFFTTPSHGYSSYGVSTTELIFHRVMVNLLFALEWVVVGFLLFVLMREMRKKRLSMPILYVSIVAAVFAFLQMLYQLILACLTPESVDGAKAMAWIYLITLWLGFFFQMVVLGLMLWQMLKVRSAAEEAT
jgi:hypothetical protein